MSIREVLNAEFTRIVKPGDTITASRETDTHLSIIRGDQEVAHADLVFADEGLEPLQVGVMLEIAAQTIVSNIAAKKNEMPRKLYPLITSVGSIVSTARRPTSGLIVIPTFFEDLGRNKFYAGAKIRDDKDNLVVTITDIQFKFATADNIETFDVIGRSWKR
jgi:hypothetical protein